MDIAGVVKAEVARQDRRVDRLLQVLRGVQERLGWLPRQALTEVAGALGLLPAQVRAVVTFYSFLHTEPRGRFEILFSDNITDHFHGKAQLMDRLCRRLEVRPGQLRADGSVLVDSTSCIGLSDHGACALVNGRPLVGLDSSRIDRVAGLVSDGVPLTDWPDDFFRVLPRVCREGPLLTAPVPAGSTLPRALALGPEGVIEEVRRAGLRGCGGAGFPTATKWKTCLDAAGRHKVVVCNADEGEPGTFKDRVLLQRRADVLLEGMTLAAIAVGARVGFIYLRAEYGFLAGELRGALDRRRRMGLLGMDILGRPGLDFDIELHLGAGAYICGEESALLESLEGRRGVPRIRPPFPAVAGYQQAPTLVNNVETLVAVACLMASDLRQVCTVGTPDSPGTKLISVSGDCLRPGVYEYEFGVSLERILSDCGADDAQAVQVAGPAGHLIPASQFQRRIAFEDLPTGGSFMVFHRDRDLMQVMLNFAAFFRHESCGFCTPCRVGTTLVEQLLEKFRRRQAGGADLAHLQRIARSMCVSSHCGLGQTAANAVLDSLARIPEVYRNRLAEGGLAPAFDLDEALEEARACTGRRDAAAHLRFPDAGGNDTRSLS